ncbi:AAA family ATPase [Flavobacterium johnsoniae]|uniref:AAA family ATPase n=1 Tax=Flavobacterium johnsoniae TaxID=986 RepID=UPI003D99517F
MRLIKFEGSKINEYLDIEIKFNCDLSILTGTNGSGKTTSLNLIQAILLPKLPDIITIPFEFIKLEIEYAENQYKIQIDKDKNSIVFNVFINSTEQLFSSFILSREYITEFDIYNIKNSDHKKIDYLFRKFQKEEYFQFINNLSKPILIGLERTSNNINNEYKDYLYERNLFLRKDTLKSNPYLHKQNLGVSILETEMLVQNVYKRVKVVRDNYYKMINKELIMSSFDFFDFDITSLADEVALNDKFRILEKRTEIEETLKSIGFLDIELSKKLSVFFEKVENVMRKLDDGDQSSTLEWLLNKSQIDKLYKVLNIIDDYNVKAKRIFEPVNRFLKIINSFLKDTSKKIFIDEVGRLLISKPSGRNLTIDELSSGERQLIILFANVIFNKYNPNRKTFSEIMIIDEPEISLHIRWQDKFVESLLEASSQTQFILASHSPDIIGDYKLQTIRINKK